MTYSNAVGEIIKVNFTAILKLAKDVHILTINIVRGYK